MGSVNVFFMGLCELMILVLDLKKRTMLIDMDKKVSEKLKKVTTEEVRLMAKEKTKKFCLVDNYLIDIEKYISSHPGGKNTLNDSMYSDVTRYLNGSVPYNSKIAAVDHKMLSCLYAINLISFAEIEEDHNIIVNSNGKSTYIYENMAIHQTRTTAGVTKEFQFKISENIKVVSFARYLKGFSWMGRHFSITSKKMNMNRLYSLCLSGNQIVHQHHLRLLDNVEILGKQKTGNTDFTYLTDLSSKYLELYIKLYPFPNAFSNYLHTNEGKIPIDDLTVKGPLGLGLNLPNEDLEGTWIAFSAGTGIYCFLDFVAVVVRKICYEAAKKENCKNNLMLENESFSLANNFKLVLFCAYPDETNAYWHDIFVRTAAIDKNYKLGIFEYYPRISTSKTKRWDKEFYFQSFKGITKEDIKRVFLCGPSTFLDSVKSSLIESQHVSEDKITLV